MSVFVRRSPWLLLLLLAGCASSGPTVTAVDDGQARALAAQGEFRAAAAEYERLARGNRGARDRLLLDAAESLREDGDFEGAGRLSSEIRRKRIDARDAARLDLLLAELALSKGDPEGALSLATLPSAQLPPAVAERAAEVRARALDLLGRPMDAVSERVGLLAQIDASQRAGLETDILDSLAALDVAQLSAALGKLDAADPRRPWLERALRLKGAAPSRVIPRPTRQVGTMLPGRSSSSEWRLEGYATTPQVALLLPLSGPLAAAGAAIRDGFFAAYFADTQQRPLVRVYDVGESAEAAVEAYANAASEGATRAVGPLAREQVAAVLAVADPRVPVLALNHPDSGAVPPAGSQQFALAPDDEAALAAEYAFTRGLRRVAMLAAAEEWSERATLAFRAQFEQLGGAVAGDARLPASAVDYAAQIAQAAGNAPDGVFLAVRPQQGRLLVPQLRARGMQDSPIIATSHIFSGNPNRALDRDLNGVDFCDAPWLFGASAGLPQREVLAPTMPSAANAPRLFAFGIDGYRLLPYLDWLARNPDAYLPGASGQLAVDDFGRVRRLLAWMRFVDGVPRAADGALSSELPASRDSP
jgi:outer membrane PBP1 activator LpoA protein